MAISATSRGVVNLLLALALAALVDWALARQTADPSPQSRVNQHFAGKPSLLTALRTYPKVWPPLYPTLLWLAQRAGVAPQQVNQALLCLVLGLFALCAASVTGTHPGFAVVALAVANFNYVNAHQATPEVLTIAVLLGLLLALGAARRHPDKPRLWLLSALAAALFLSRYFALFFMLPLLALELFWLARPGRARRVLGVCGIALLPVVVWMGVAFTQTGHLTGSDRFAPRNLREEIQDWGELTTLPANLALFARTHTVDFLSTSAYASHSVVDRPYEMAPHELALLALSALCAGLLLQDGWRRLAAGGRTPQQRLGALRASPLYLPLAALASYHAMLIGLWSVGNNDPLYTRFLYPSYPLLLLVAFGAYARLRATRPWPLRLPFQLLYVSLIGVHLWRDHQALALPLR